MDRFSFIFAFYGLILGLAVTEVLGGFADYARERRIRDLEPQTALLALFVFLDISATWIDAWDTLRDVSLNFEGLWAPLLTATSLYLAAAMVFPRKTAELSDLQSYYQRRKQFVLIMLIASEIFIGFMFIPVYRAEYAHRPAVFWLFDIPFKLLIIALFAALILARGRRSNIAIIVALIAVFTVPYWTHHAVTGWIHGRFDQPS
ncbi:MAG: hypothetical protein ACJ8FB_12595 [Sphingomicrobium sp.]